MPRINNTNTILMDADGYVLGEDDPGRLAFQDASAVPLLSPQTIATTPVALTVPFGARWLIFTSTGSCRYGDNPSLDGITGGFKRGTPGVNIHYPVGTTSKVYIQAESGSTVVDFLFELMT